MKKKQYLFILCGEAFSGKTTFSQKLSELTGAKIIGRDKIYFVLDDVLALEETPDEEDSLLWNSLWPIAVQGAKNQLLLGNSVVFDDNCLLLRQRGELRSVAKNAGVQCILIYFNLSVETLRKRKEENKINKNRHDVPSGWLENDAQKFEHPTEIENPIIYTEKDSFDELIKKIDAMLWKN
jgi:predicted kinase